eukprot:scaffold476_cov111-Isochrysis_galbana.AAC.4
MPRIAFMARIAFIVRSTRRQRGEEGGRGEVKWHFEEWRAEQRICHIRKQRRLGAFHRPRCLLTYTIPAVPLCLLAAPICKLCHLVGILGYHAVSFHGSQKIGADPGIRNVVEHVCAVFGHIRLTQPNFAGGHGTQLCNETHRILLEGRARVFDPPFAVVGLSGKGALHCVADHYGYAPSRDGRVEACRDTVVASRRKTEERSSHLLPGIVNGTVVDCFVPPEVNHSFRA